jgi:hypothetical protein
MVLGMMSMNDATIFENQNQMYKQQVTLSTNGVKQFNVKDELCTYIDPGISQ